MEENSTHHSAAPLNNGGGWSSTISITLRSKVTQTDALGEVSATKAAEGTSCAFLKPFSQERTEVMQLRNSIKHVSEFLGGGEVGVCLWPWMSWKQLCRPGCPQTHKDPPPSTGAKGITTRPTSCPRIKPGLRHEGRQQAFYQGSAVPAQVLFLSPDHVYIWSFVG